MQGGERGYIAKAAAVAATSSPNQIENAKRHRTDIVPNGTAIFDISVGAASTFKQRHSIRSHQTLLCGLRAVNAILRLHRKSIIERHQIDAVNKDIAELEASLSDDLVSSCTHLQPEGNYALDVIATALQRYGSLSLAKAELQPNGTPLPGIYLVGDGDHWQVLYSRPEGKWARCDGPAFPIPSCADFVRRYLDLGVLLYVTAAEPAAPCVAEPSTADVAEVTAQRSDVLSADANDVNCGGQLSHSDDAIADIDGDVCTFSASPSHDASTVPPGGNDNNRQPQPRETLGRKHATPVVPHPSSAPESMEIDKGTSSSCSASSSTPTAPEANTGNNVATQSLYASSVSQQIDRPLLDSAALTPASPCDSSAVQQHESRCSPSEQEVSMMVDRDILIAGSSILDAAACNAATADLHVPTSAFADDSSLPALFKCPFSICGQRRGWRSLYPLLRHIESKHLPVSLDLPDGFVTSTRRWICPSCRVFIPLFCICRL